MTTPTRTARAQAGPCRHRWLLVAAAGWFASAGFWFVLAAVNMLSDPWDLICRLILGLAGLAFAAFVFYDAWSDARAARRLLEQHTELMLRAMRERDA